MFLLILLRVIIMWIQIKGDFGVEKEKGLMKIAVHGITLFYEKTGRGDPLLL